MHYITADDLDAFFATLIVVAVIGWPLIDGLFCLVRKLIELIGRKS